MSRIASLYAPYRLTFILPDALAGTVSPGIHCPRLGCSLTIDGRGLVTIEGRTRGLVFDQASRFFRTVAKDRPAFMRSAILITPDRRREHWEIAVNSAVTFTRDIAPVVVGADEVEIFGKPPHG